MSRNTTTDENGLPPPLAPQPAAATGSPVAVRVVAFAAMAVIYGLAYFQRTGIPGTIFDELQHDFGLSASAVTALGAVFIYVYAGMQLVVGDGGGPLRRTANAAVRQRRHVRRVRCCSPARIPRPCSSPVAC